MTNGTVTAGLNGSELPVEFAGLAFLLTPQRGGIARQYCFIGVAAIENMRRFGVKLLTRGGIACLNRARSRSGISSHPSKRGNSSAILFYWGCGYRKYETIRCETIDAGRHRVLKSGKRS